MSTVGMAWCTACNGNRPATEFRVPDSGKLRKTCLRHLKKRKLNDAQHADWSDFIDQIRNWNVPGQTAQLSIDLTFDIDRLPVVFGGRTELLESSQPEWATLNTVVNELLSVIRDEGGFRYRLRRRNGHQYIHHCSQDADNAPALVEASAIHRRRPDRFPCESRLAITPSLNQRSLRVELEHKFHTSSSLVSLSDEAIKFIAAKAKDSTPAKIYSDLRGNKDIPGYQQINRYQVSYRWHQANVQSWKRDADQVQSATKLLQEMGHPSQNLTSANAGGLAFYFANLMETITSGYSIQEMAMDATFGTNSAGMELFAVMTELDGAGIPLGYCFVWTSFGDVKAPGALHAILVQFLQGFRERGLSPSFFGTDKDPSEISAIREVWPEAKIQLCHWHINRALKTKLGDKLSYRPQDRYYSGEVLELLADSTFDSCWACLPTKRATTDHRYGRCSCASKGVDFSAAGCLEVSAEEEIKEVIEVIERHSNAHPLLPKGGIFRGPLAIHRDCVLEAFQWCKARSYPRLWAYLWVNWYRPGQWILWARSTHPQIPVLKTTMIVESHWKTLKHSYLHDFNQPRIDLVIWIILEKVLTDAADRAANIIARDPRKDVASWRPEYKKEWFKHVRWTMDPEKLAIYGTDPHAWTCGCPYFVCSRFLLCKHIVSCFEDISYPWEFLRTVKRHRISPFWTDPQLVLLPEFQAAGSGPVGGSDSASNLDAVEQLQDASSVAGSSVSGAEADDSSGVDQVPTTEEMMATVKEHVQWLNDLVKGEGDIKNESFFKHFFNHPDFKHIQALRKDVERRSNQRSMPRTWDKYLHSLSMYVKGRLRRGPRNT
jgi:MULE transposase domain